MRTIAKTTHADNPIPSSMNEPNDSKRRLFFREAAARLISPLADYIDPRTDEPRESRWLRPPGAIAESALVETCLRCGACVEVCPADAIFALGETEGPAAGTPAIDPDRAPCVVCDGLPCTTACPSGALLPLVSPGDIAMGLAEVYSPLCVRTHDESCDACVEGCPLGAAAIHFTGDGPPTVLEAGCVGCGVCQFRCPTEPKAIIIGSNPHR